MTIYYVDSAAGSNTSPYDTWAKAATTLGAIAAIPPASGDTIYVASTHNETGNSAAQDLNGTQASPTKVICADKTSGAPPTTPATGGKQTSAGTSVTSGLQFTGYCYGLTFVVSPDGGNPRLQFKSDVFGEFSMYEQCTFDLNTGSGKLVIGVDGNSVSSDVVRWKNCNLKFGQTITQCVSTSGGTLIWDGGATQGSALASTLFNNGGSFATREGDIICSGVDFSSLGSTVSFFDATGNTVRGTLRNCKLPASWAGSLATGSLASRSRFEMWNCDSASTNYRLWIKDYAGDIVQDTVNVKSLGAMDGAVRYSWKMTSSANAEFPHLTLRSPEMVKRIDVVGTQKTVSIDIIHDNQGAGAGGMFQNDEVWIEVQYLSDSGSPLGSFLSTAKVLLATAALPATSSVAWDHALTTPKKQVLSVQFTPLKKGFVHVVVHLAKASKTVYVDPQVQVT